MTTAKGFETKEAAHSGGCCAPKDYEEAITHPEACIAVGFPFRIDGRHSNRYYITAYSYYCGRVPAQREPTTGLLAKEASFRLIVSGDIGVKEIERLIQKLEIDREILADQHENQVPDSLK